MADLVTGRFGQLNPLWNIIGQPTNAVQSDIPARSNIEYLGVGNGLTDTTASLATGVMTAVPIPIDPGTTVSHISILTGNTAASTTTHAFSALYSGTTVAAPPLIAQTPDLLATMAAPASTRYDFTFSTAQTITAAQAPYGYVWAAIMVAVGTTIPSLVTTSATNAAVCQYAWWTNMLAGLTTSAFGITSGSGITTTAPATLIYASQKLLFPIVFLW